ncbi:MAG: hypothetical protein SVV03_01495 [Candidatus Nanohaloarchaea archaeon]|nr:hypothetical protein [Candidatus Nanohaloarchaea archaeon]
MPVQTSIPWLDRDLKEAGSCYIRCRNKALRHRILAETVSYSAHKGDTLLLSFTNPRKGFWSFDFNRLLGRCRAISDMPRLKKNLDIQRIDSMGRLEDNSWKNLSEKDHRLVVGDRITHLKSGNLEKYSALDVTAENLEKLEGKKPLIILDKNPVYRKLAKSVDTVVQLDKREDKILKRTNKGQKSFEEYIKPGRKQRTLAEYAKVTK